MKKIVVPSFVIAIGAIGGFVTTSKNQTTVVPELALSNTKAVADCETSSNASQYTGYCFPKTGGGGDACVDNGASDAVRCSGNN